MYDTICTDYDSFLFYIYRYTRVQVTPAVPVPQVYSVLVWPYVLSVVTPLYARCTPSAVYTYCYADADMFVQRQT